jgi:hypothetical protein
MTKCVGIIVNPAAGKDLRRVVACGITTTHTEKINTVVRILRALDSLGVERVRIAGDPTNLGQRAIEIAAAELSQLDAGILELPWLLGARIDTERSAELMCEQNYACIIVLGGDGTSRAVAAHCGDVPLIPISTGTNNAFPRMIEGTLVGMAAACVVNVLTGEEALQRAPMLRLYADGAEISHALVDIAVIDTLDCGAVAVWEGASIRELFLAQARPDSIGLSAIGGVLDPLTIDEGEGLHLQMGSLDDPACMQVIAPIAPGLVIPLAINSVERFSGATAIRNASGVLAFDGEREIAIEPGQRWEVVLDTHGPRVVDIQEALRLGIQRGLFRRNFARQSQP